MFYEEDNPDLKAAENAEMYRIFDAYGPLSPSRIPNTKLNASAVNPEKKDEAELSSEELLIALNNREAVARARAANLLETRPPTFHLAEAVKDAMEIERNLEALRYEKRAFSRLTGFSNTGAIDAEKELAWWKENEARLKRELPK